jgi:hypothetical protein
MNRSVQVGNTILSLEYPEKCPVCHHHGEMKQLHTSYTRRDTEIQVVYQCAFAGCKSFFIGHYNPREGGIKSLAPMNVVPNEFQEVVLKLSPTFVSVYQEAYQAQHLGLGHIAGPGYRKAFEFLIKDYAKALDPSKVSEIESSFAGAVVNNYVSDPRIQAVAKRTLWLGNDETHYLRKWSDHDLNDLVTLIRLTVAWIEIDQLSKGYISDMPIS